MAAGLRGFVGQGMVGRKPNKIAQPPYIFPTGTYNFTPPKAGFWLFVGWGAGGGAPVAGGDGGGSGAYFEITRYVNTGQTVAIVVGTPTYGSIGAATTVTIPGVPVATAGGGGTGAGGGGIASGGDYNLNGSDGALAGTGNGVAGQGTGGGAAGIGAGASGSGAPARLPYRGGKGGDGGSGSTKAAATSPGGGNSSDTATLGGSGLVLAIFVRT